MSTIRISEPTHAVLRSLAAENGETMQAILEKAIDEYRRQLFWDEVETAAVALRRNPAAWEDELAERRAWDATLADGQEAE